MTSIHAIVITKPGEPNVLELQTREIADPQAGEVLIEVHAAGVNRPDVLQRKGLYPVPSGQPADIPGLEIAGIIIKCGASVDRWKVGDHVCALVGGGGYATHALADGRHCLPIPVDWTFVEACTLPETVFTVWHNVFQRGHLAPGEKLLVHGGSSGIGITAIQLAKALASPVVTTAGTDEKCSACLALGAEQCINYKNEDFEAVFKHKTIDVILDMIGGDYIPKNLRLLRDDGRLVFINAVKGGKFEFDAQQLMQRRLTITGSTLRGRSADFKADLTAEIEAKVWPLISAGKFVPVVYRVFELADAAAAHTLMESSEHIGKIVLEVKTGH